MPHFSIDFPALRKAVEAHATVSAQVREATQGLRLPPRVVSGRAGDVPIEFYVWPLDTQEFCVLATGPGMRPKLSLGSQLRLGEAMLERLREAAKR